VYIIDNSLHIPLKKTIFLIHLMLYTVKVWILFDYYKYLF